MSRYDRPPIYRRHKGAGQAFVEYKGRRMYLGKYGSPESHQEYARVLDVVRKTGRLPNAKDVTVSEVVLGFMSHVEVYYRKDGKPTTEQGNFKQALRFLVDLHGATVASEFGPLALRQVRDAMIQAGRCRSVINKDVNRVRMAFRWAVEEELVEGSVYHALQAVRPLKKGRCEAPDHPPVLSVPAEDVEATLPFLPPIVADMVRLQLLTGARPIEIRLLKPEEVDRVGEVWEYIPGAHKTEHHGKERRLFFGPRAQEVLAPYLARPADAYCFSPAESERRRNEAKRAARQSPMTPSQAERNGDPSSGASDCYSKDAYVRAITRACEKAGVPRWTPHRLRHTLATQVRREYGLEAAQTVLGHSQADVTQIYAERDFAKARSIMAAIG